MVFCIIHRFVRSGNILEQEKMVQRARSYIENMDAVVMLLKRYQELVGVVKTTRTVQWIRTTMRLAMRNIAYI